MSRIQTNKISGIRAGFFADIRPDSKNHYPVHPYILAVSVSIHLLGAD
jgi:hypothetical protein